MGIEPRTSGRVANALNSWASSLPTDIPSLLILMLHLGAGTTGSTPHGSFLLWGLTLWGFCLFVYLFHCIYVLSLYVNLQVYHSPHVRGQLEGISSLLLPCGSWGLNSGTSAAWSWPAELHCRLQPWLLVLFNFACLFIYLFTVRQRLELRDSYILNKHSTTDFFFSFLVSFLVVCWGRSGAGGIWVFVFECSTHRGPQRVSNPLKLEL